MRMGADGRRILTPEEQKQEFAKARGCKFCEHFEYVDEVLVNGKSRGRTTHYTWQKLNFCPVCGKQLENKSKRIY